MNPVVPCGEIISPRCDNCPWNCIAAHGEQRYCEWMETHPDADPVAEAAHCPHPLPTLAELREHEEEETKILLDMVWASKHYRLPVTPDLALIIASVPCDTETMKKLHTKPDGEHAAWVVVQKSDSVLLSLGVATYEGGKEEIFINLDHGGQEAAARRGQESAIFLQCNHILWLLPHMDSEKLFRYEVPEGD